jgi:hypothetical protein
MAYEAVLMYFCWLSKTQPTSNPHTPPPLYPFQWKKRRAHSQTGKLRALLYKKRRRSVSTSSVLCAQCLSSFFYFGALHPSFYSPVTQKFGFGKKNIIKISSYLIWFGKRNRHIFVKMSGNGCPMNNGFR